MRVLNEFGRDAQARILRRASRSLRFGLWQNRAHKGHHEDAVGQKDGFVWGSLVCPRCFFAVRRGFALLARIRPSLGVLGFAVVNAL